MSCVVNELDTTWPGAVESPGIPARLSPLPPLTSQTCCSIISQLELSSGLQLSLSFDVELPCRGCIFVFDSDGRWDGYMSRR